MAVTWPLVPCPTCPWRRTSTVGGSDIPGFQLDMMRGLACTVGEGDDFRRVVACHYSPDPPQPGMRPCAGYLARHGYSNLYVRLMAAQGEVDLAGTAEACEDLDLWPDFATMLAAYEEAQNNA
jgi:uncharacterized protein DUF6283